MKTARVYAGAASAGPEAERYYIPTAQPSVSKMA
jgi:hypothetical protein